MLNTVRKMLNELKNGKLYAVTIFENVQNINQYIMKVLTLDDWDKETIETVKEILTMCNILYNNSSQNVRIIEDGVYDILLEKFKRYSKVYPIGAEPIRFDESVLIHKNETDTSTVRWDIVNNGDMLYYQDVMRNDHQYDFDIKDIPPWYIKLDDHVNTRTVPHNNLELVGTLDKCKFVLCKDAMDAGVYYDSNVKIFERDFLQKHLNENIITMNTELTMIGELKYDGIGVDALIENGELIYANTRGDTNNDKTVDLTPFLGGYSFPRAQDLKGKIGVQFEAIIQIPHMNYLKNRFGLNYVNARNAVIGISSRKDARMFRDFITLVPLKTDIMMDGEHIDRLVEIEFLNKYIARDVNLKFSIFTGPYISVLYQVKRFVNEMQYMRSFMPFLYDGVVISYYGDEIRKILGRENFVDKFSMAIKFPSLKKETIFTGYKYTIGQNGVITPIIYYNPVEFYGAIHDHSSGHSYKRFQELGLKLGDVIQVEYTNDVMPYVTKMDIQANYDNPNPVVPFIKNCPFCGCPIQISESSKSATCPNIECKGRAIARITNMVSKLDLRDFGEKTMELLEANLKATSLRDLFNLTTRDVSFLGPTNSINLIDRINKLKSENIYDYEIIGSLGFTNIAKSKWKMILNYIPLTDILNQDPDELKVRLMDIKGIGMTAVRTILVERNVFRDDIEMILTMNNVIPSYHMKKGLKIRFSGIRDKALVRKISAMGHDIGEGAVSKDTDILIVPDEEHKSIKVYQAMKNGTIIIPYREFLNSLDKFLS